MKTKVFIENFKGHDLFAIYEVDDNDNKLKNTPFMSFGGTKANAIVAHMKELEDFAKSKAKNSIKANIDMSKLSSEEQDAIQSILAKASAT